jgi:GNAT superfamily N-acetyltransferase
MLASDRSLAQRLERDAGTHLVEYVRGLESDTALDFDSPNIESLESESPEPKRLEPRPLEPKRLEPEATLETRPEWEAREIADGVMVRTGKLGINVAVGLGLHGPVSDPDLNALEAFFVGAGRTPRIELCPLTDPGLLSPLAARGFAPQRFVQTLVRPIDPDERFEVTPEVQILAVTPDLEPAWIHAFRSGFGGRDASQPSQIDATLATIALNRPGSSCFLARQHGEIIGTGSLVVREDGEGWRIGTLYLASTAPHARGRGVQHALVHARLEAARRAGCDAVTTQAKPGATPGLERQGFGVVYTKVVLEQRGAAGRAVTLEF